jgi:hypothetical protein
MMRRIEKRSEGRRKEERKLRFSYFSSHEREYEKDSGLNRTERRWNLNRKEDEVKVAHEK